MYPTMLRMGVKFDSIGCLVSRGQNFVIAVTSNLISPTYNVYLLFDPRSNISYVNSYFAIDFRMEPKFLIESCFVNIFVGVPVIASRV